MASVEMSHVDLEYGYGHRRSSSTVTGGDGDGGGSDDGESVCFSDANEGSCYSQFYSTIEGPYDNHSFACASDLENGDILGSRRASSVADTDCLAETENGVHEIKVHLERVERDCRICHLTLESSNGESGIAIELGCSCKDDLAAAHKNCAEVWFKIKGNKTCEICNSVARNVFSANETESTQQTSDTNVTTTNAVPAQAPSSTDNRSCMNGHRFVNFLLACMVFVFIISWLFHFNIPS